MRRVLLKYRYEKPWTVTHMRTRCCEADTIAVGHSGAKRISMRVLYVRCGGCGKEGWMAEPGRVNEPTVPCRSTLGAVA